jgi:hypothetical protein
VRQSAEHLPGELAGPACPAKPIRSLPPRHWSAHVRRRPYPHRQGPPSDSDNHLHMRKIPPHTQLPHTHTQLPHTATHHTSATHAIYISPPNTRRTSTHAYAYALLLCDDIDIYAGRLIMNSAPVVGREPSAFDKVFSQSSCIRCARLSTVWCLTKLAACLPLSSPLLDVAACVKRGPVSPASEPAMLILCLVSMSVMVMPIIISAGWRRQWADAISSS